MRWLEDALNYYSELSVIEDAKKHHLEPDSKNVSQMCE
jgi:hypothetical protein